MKLRCLLVDDEPLAIRVLENLLKPMADVFILGVCEHVGEVKKWLEMDQPDFILLDINLPRTDGLALARALPPGIQVVFTTAYREFGPEAFELNATDYLVKPIHPDRLGIALSKVRERHRSVSPGNDGPQQLWIAFGREQIKINVADIWFIESKNDHVLIHTKTQSHKYYDTLANMEAQLTRAGFLRIHKSFLVNQAAIASFSTQQMKVGTVPLPIGRSYKQQVLNSMIRRDSV